MLVSRSPVSTSVNAPTLPLDLSGAVDRETSEGAAGRGCEGLPRLSKVRATTSMIGYRYGAIASQQYV